MTDNEIIKALEQHNNYKTCSPCPYEKHSDTRYCLDVLLSDVFLLVIRQKEEIKRLRDEIEHLHKVIDDLSETIEGGVYDDTCCGAKMDGGKQDE